MKKSKRDKEALKNKLKSKIFDHLLKPELIILKSVMKETVLEEFVKDHVLVVPA